MSDIPQVAIDRAVELAESSEELQKVAYRQAQAVLHALQEGAENE